MRKKRDLLVPLPPFPPAPKNEKKNGSLCDDDAKV